MLAKVYVLNGGQVSLSDLFEPIEFVLLLGDAFLQRGVQFFEVLDLVGQERLPFVDLLALFPCL